jgi:hypothetical protein
MVIRLNPTPNGESEMGANADNYLSVPEYRTNE